MLLIGEVAARAGVATSAIRYYEERGLVRSVRRESGHRLFAEQAANRVRAITVAREAGFSLDEIKRLLDSQSDGTEQWRALVDDKIASVEVRVARLHAIAQILRDSLDCGCRAWDECPVAMSSGSSAHTTP